MFRFLYSSKSKKMFEGVEAEYLRLQTAIEAFQGKGTKEVTKEQLAAFELFKWYEVNPGVWIRRRANRFETLLNFDTTMVEGGEFGTHFHGDIIESFEILEGKVKDLIDNKIYSKGDVVNYLSGQKHHPMALEYTELNVLFKAV